MHTFHQHIALTLHGTHCIIKQNRSLEPLVAHTRKEALIMPTNTPTLDEIQQFFLDLDIANVSSQNDSACDNLSNGYQPLPSIYEPARITYSDKTTS